MYICICKYVCIYVCIYIYIYIYIAASSQGSPRAMPFSSSSGGREAVRRYDVITIMR